MKNVKKTTCILLAAAALLVLGAVLLGTAKRPVTPAARTVAKKAAPAISSPYFKESVSPIWGRYLTDAEGRTLYTYAHDKPSLARCVLDCLVKHPSYGPNSGDNSSASMAKLPGNIGIFQSLHGPQFTWQGMPLYRYADDATPGEINGVNLIWHVVNL